jgi:hypothetical protein
MKGHDRGTSEGHKPNKPPQDSWKRPREAEGRKVESLRFMARDTGWWAAVVAAEAAEAAAGGGSGVSIFFNNLPLGGKF